jgi:phosphate transport system substrate-binding protein
MKTLLSIFRDRLPKMTGRGRAGRCVEIVLRALVYASAALAAHGVSTIEAMAAETYVPRAVEVSKEASYVLPDGSVYIVGNDGMEDLLNQWNDHFTKTHPQIKFTMLLRGSSTGIGGLTAGVSAFAPMGREAWPTDLSGFREAFGYEPVDFRVGYDGYSRPKHKNPPAIYVHAKNPLAGLTTAQLIRVFVSGAPGGDITHWGQLGVNGPWAKRAIHLYGPRDDGGAATSIRYGLMGKRPFQRSYEGFAKLPEIVAAVAADPFGIGLVGYFDSSAIPEVRVVPLAKSDADPFVLPTAENVGGGKYPLTPYLHIYVNRAPGHPLDPLVKEYLRFVLSPEGQAVVDRGADGDEAFLPLDSATLADELRKLE